MKKFLLCTMLVVFCACLVGCGKKEEEKEPKVIDDPVAGSYTVNTDIKMASMSKSAKEVFELAIKDSKEELEPVALLGTQVVAGTNYMYLCKSNAELKVAVVYKDLEGNASITKVNNFNISDFTNNDSTNSDEKIAGGWTINSADPKVELEEKAQEAFTKATADLTGKGYKPIALLGTQVVAGTNYSVLALGTTVTKEPTYSLNVLTIYNDLEGNASVTNISNVDLSQFNK